MRSASILTSERYLLLALAALGALAIYAAFEPTVLLTAAIGIVLLLFLALRGYKFGMVLLVAVVPFLGLRFQLPPFRSGIPARFFPDGVDLSLANTIGLLLISCVVGDIILRWILSRTRFRLRLPGIMYVIGFLFASLLSVVNATDIPLSIKYVLFPVAFSILVFLYLPVNLIRTRRFLMQVLRVAYATGILAAVMGVLSIIVVPSAGLLKRATVFGFLGIFPFGTNHNALAEALLSILPYGFALSWLSRSSRMAFWYRAGTVFMSLVALLTFARTAWIVLAVQGLLWVWLQYRHRIRSLIRPTLTILLLASPLIMYMIVFSRSPVVSGSTESRLALTNFALFQFFEHPIVGAGAGTFVERLGGTLDFTQDFGDPLDAHGFVQKILAENGTLGMATFSIMIYWILRSLYRSWKSIPSTARGEKRLMLMMFLSVTGSICYQLFNTSYYNAKLWLPIGLALTVRELTRRKI